MADRFRVLVIDDDPGVRDYMEALVSRQGYRVHAAADGEQALARLDDVRPDLVTLDVVLPGMNGFQATRALSREPPTKSIPVLIVSTKGMDTDRAWGLRQGAKDYIVKPPSEDALIARIDRLLGTGA